MTNNFDTISTRTQLNKNISYKYTVGNLTYTPLHNRHIAYGIIKLINIFNDIKYKK